MIPIIEVKPLSRNNVPLSAASLLRTCADAIGAIEAELRYVKAVIAELETRTLDKEPDG